MLPYVIERIIKRKTLLCAENQIIYAARGYSIFKSFDLGRTWILDGYITDPFSRLLSHNRLLSRFTRTEVKALIVMQNGNRICIARKGIFWAEAQKPMYQKVFNITRGSRPLNICKDANDTLYFGEYFNNSERTSLYIYKSTDSGKTWSRCYMFPAGSIRHIHGIFYDKYEDLLWFLTGDLDGECLIGNSSDGFQSINIIAQGGQQVRAAQLLFFPDCIIYGTDTEYEQNYIYVIDRKTLKRERMQLVQGSVLSACRVGEYAFIGTTVEPSHVNLDKYSYIWYSKDKCTWEVLVRYEKDCLASLFQYGRVEFMYGEIAGNYLCYAGHALKDIDNTSLIVQFE